MTTGPASPAATAPDPARQTGRPTTRPSAPGWPEILVGLIAYVVCFALVFWLLPLAGGGALGGIIGLLVSGVMGLIAFGAAWALRIRSAAAFGFRRASPRQLLAGAGLGLLAAIIGSALSIGYVVLSGDMQAPQSSYQAASMGGALSLALTLVGGSIITPIGEESLFRGVIANALLARYGAWVGVLASMIVFALFHGINTVLPSAFMVGLFAALLFRRTGSIWPGVVLHGTNNLVSSLLPLALASLAAGA
ncbi:CPBP family intramembrane glutamic endopeptidase [Brachybacterium subflavum]|uniref:CPBP family intramembrane glutamic endopeptidase n=1 Tax=Brachybacterium subflavum TaxID=2585206 RepID=UPI0012664D5A|nr:type II CAAX endopeptidase family protein [Brachybacterium subflavum]